MTKPSSEQSEREGEAPSAMPVDGVTRAPINPALTTTRSIWIKSLVSGLIILVVSWLSASHREAVSALVGIGVALLNFWLLERLVSGLLQRQRASFKRLLLTFAAKILILFGLLGFVVLKVPLEMGYFLLGLSCVVVGIVVEGLQGLFFSPAAKTNRED